MRTTVLILTVLLAFAAFLLALPGVVLAIAEMTYGRNLTWGPVLLASHAIAALSAVIWGAPLMTRRTTGHWGWFLLYFFAFATGIAAVDQMHFNFLT